MYDPLITRTLSRHNNISRATPDKHEIRTFSSACNNRSNAASRSEHPQMVSHTLALPPQTPAYYLWPKLYRMSNILALEYQAPDVVATATNFTFDTVGILLIYAGQRQQKSTSSQIYPSPALPTDPNLRSCQLTNNSLQARSQLAPPATPGKQLLRLPPLLPRNLRVHGHDSRRPKRPHRLPHQQHPGVLLPIPGLNAAQDRGHEHNPAHLPRHPDPRGLVVPATRQHAALPCSLQGHGWRCHGAAAA
ncbi:uncharacterized protein DSM5745_05291 [Aspergillus mulundensis]|uniref:Uncharacterized protein n=1 Tax=Aspergillus mulundensis TaxID=1810919 RepID=A0A3D8S6S7_9EURO|nr:hypothetical protein DSM5745_05291 [Aspergillus mulundensis]RDW81734.1 hypothetical protein DSM5745_05291 [Aspergillus mulundensis]